MNAQDFAAFSTSNLCNAHNSVRALPMSIKPIIPGKRVAGFARTARIAPGQNAAVHRAVHHATPGEMLVVDAAGSERFGPFGDLLADCCKSRGMAGAVFNCTVRDSADIAALGFQVFSRGTHPEPTAKVDPGETDIALRIGGVEIAPGDIVVGDDDGVVVVPAALSHDVLKGVAGVCARENAIRARILAGETTFDIFGLGGTGAPASVDTDGSAMRPGTFFNFSDLSRGIARNLAPGIDTRVFAGEDAMLSVVHFEPGCAGSIHSHPEEQWGVLLEGGGVRIQDGVDVPVAEGDFWLTPGNVPHGFRAGPEGAKVLDIFAPPREAYRKAGSGFGT